MKMLKTFAVAASMIAATAATAQAGDYRKCKDTEAAIAGGVVGGSLGTIIGEEIAGRGNKTEGAILGGIIGGIAGAAVGDSASDCEKDGRIYSRARDGRYYPRAYPTRTQNYGYGSAPVYQRAGHPGPRSRTRQVQSVTATMTGATATTTVACAVSTAGSRTCVSSVVT